MNVYDLAHNLARGLKTSPEYQKYQGTLSKIKEAKKKKNCWPTSEKNKWKSRLCS